MSTKKATWIFWSVFSVFVLVYFFVTIQSEDKTVFAPGEMTHGHHQIEMACAACHTDPFGGGEVLQSACVNCHGAELKAIDDSHPKSKFTNPRNANRVKELDARVCITCHTEHQNEITGEMGVTLPEDFCFKCHADVAENRISHKGMAFTTCANGGCHNYHDNSALYEDFLEKHIGEPEHFLQQHVKQKSDASQLVTLSQYPLDRFPLKPLTSADNDVSFSLVAGSDIKHDWESTAHAQAGVNCSACHQVKDEDNQISWVEKPTEESCKSCHTDQVAGFLEGRHGMRIKAGLEPMTPAMARAPMRPNAHSKSLTCVSCHSSHKFDVQQAAVDSCLGCHDDSHSNAYKKSPHFQTWHKEINGQSAPNTGVSCASCHMPRKEIKQGDHKFIITEHNQNLNLRPNEKMLRSVCMDCHGLGFSIDALADKKLIETNFSGKPTVHIESIDLVEDRLKERLKKSQKSKEDSR